MSRHQKLIVVKLVGITIWPLFIVLSFVLGLSATVYAHDGGFPFRYVAPNGVDSGGCHDPASPCRTILYAVDQAIPGDEIRVASGAYYFPYSELALLWSEVIPIRGGYSLDNAFTIQNPAAHPTYLIGLPQEYEALAKTQGFILIRDAKMIELGSAGVVTGDSPAPFAEIAGQNPTAFTRCVNGFAETYPCQGVDLLSRIPLDQFSSEPTSANDIWGYVDLDDNREYALIGLRNGTAVVNISDPLNPVEVGVIPGPNTVWRDIKVFQFYNESQSRWDAYAYVVADLVNQGLQIIDLSQLPDSISLANTYSGFNRAHNIYLSDVDYTTGLTQSGSTAYAYILGSEHNLGGFRILDLSNPTAPLETAAPVTAQYVHDATTFVITDARTVDCAMGHNPCELYVDFNENTVDIWDVTDKSQPYKISATPYGDSAYTHSGWWSADKMYIFIQDELDERYQENNTILRTLDISDLTTPFISRVWEGPTTAIDHNGFTKASHYYMSNYRRGLTILDVSDANQPNDIAFFDTFPANDNANFNGAWGTYPYLPSGAILVSDIEGGLFVLREQGLAISLTGPEASSVNLPLTYTLTITNQGVLPATEVVVSDKLPLGTAHLSGGVLAGDTVSWRLDSLAPHSVAQFMFVVSANSAGSVTNSDYQVQAKGSIAAEGLIQISGNQAVTTFVTEAVIYLPLIIK